jgi:hypothetical protein
MGDGDQPHAACASGTLRSTRLPKCASKIPAVAAATELRLRKVMAQLTTAVKQGRPKKAAETAVEPLYFVTGNDSHAEQWQTC